MLRPFSLAYAVVGYVERRSKQPTWLPRQKLAEERITSATTTIENSLPTEIENFRNKKIKKNRPLKSEPSLRLFTYLENFNLAETFRKSF